MSFANKATVVYKVHPEPDSDGRSGHLSVRTDRKNKSGQWSVSNRALVMALVEGSYLNSWMVADDLDIEGDDDGVLFVSYYTGRGRTQVMPLYQLEYERHHDIEEKPKGLFGEPGAQAPMSRSNPFSFSSLSTGEKVGIAAAGAAVLGVIGYAIWKSQQSAASASNAASLPVVQTPMPGTTPVAPGTVSTGGQVFDPNLGGSGVMPVYSGVAPGNPAPGSLIGGG